MISPAERTGEWRRSNPVKYLLMKQKIRDNKRLVNAPKVAEKLRKRNDASETEARKSRKLLYNKEYSKVHRGRYYDRERIYYYEHRNSRVAYMKEYVSRNREELSKRALAKYHSDPITNLRTRIMVRLSQTIDAKNPRHNKWLDILGYSINDLKSHLERLFTAGMNWENHGEWHIDHKIPVSAFNFSSVDDLDFRRCWALSNLRPLWALDNLKKSAHLERPFQPSLAISS